MKLFRILFIIIVFSSTCLLSRSQDVSFIALGDMHYDRLDDHDLDYVMTRPQDYKQIFTEYPQYTAFFMPKFLQLIKKQTMSLSPTVKAVIQLGDLVEGVSGNFILARQMNRGVVDMLHNVQLPVPWVLVKGNHDVSNSPGQPEAWDEVIRPFIERQVGKSVGNGMYTYKINENTEFFVLDQFFSIDKNVPEIDMVSFLEKELNHSKAKYKFVLTHQPVIPVSQRCWHLLSGIRRPVQDSLLRNRFLNLLAKHKVIVLSAHEHMYSILSRKTPNGNIVQVMINSVNRQLEPPIPKNIDTEFKGGKWVEENLAWQPSTNTVRTKILDEEKKFISKFMITDLPGYAQISIDDKKEEIVLHFYNGLSEVPYESTSLTDLQSTKK